MLACVCILYGATDRGSELELFSISGWLLRAKCVYLCDCVCGVRKRKKKKEKKNGRILTGPKTVIVSCVV